MSLNDIYSKILEHHYRYWDTKGGFRKDEPLKMPIAPNPAELSNDPKIVADLIRKAVMDGYNVDTLITAIIALKTELVNKDVLKIKNPNWIEPPLDAKIIDIFNNARVFIDTTVVVPIVDKPLLKLTVPKGAIAVIQGFGHNAEAGAGAWNDLAWTLKIDGNTISNNLSSQYMTAYAVASTVLDSIQYSNFHMQLGTIVVPFKFPMPFVLKDSQTFEVWVQNTSEIATYYANARITGFLFYPSSTSQFVYSKEMHHL